MFRSKLLRLTPNKKISGKFSKIKYQRNPVILAWIDEVSNLNNVSTQYFSSYKTIITNSDCVYNLFLFLPRKEKKIFRSLKTKEKLESTFAKRKAIMELGCSHMDQIASLRIVLKYSTSAQHRACPAYTPYSKQRTSSTTYNPHLLGSRTGS